MAKKLPFRPNLEHLRKQAKTLLVDLKKSRPTKGKKLADAQFMVARGHGFKSWPALVRHVDLVNALQGEWHFVALQIDGVDLAAGALSSSRLLMDGDRFRMESAEGNYDGHFSIDSAAEPMRIDIEFVEGPEANNTSQGIFEISRDQLTMCIGVVGASRPKSFSTKKGSGHALERLRRASAARQPRATGGTPQPASGPGLKTRPPIDQGDAKAFDVPMTPLLRRLEGEWAAVALVRDGEVMREDWLPFGSRVGIGNETKVIFGGQVMAHAKVRIDETTSPMAVDYLNLAGAQKGSVSLGIMDWAGEEVRFLMAAPGQPRPSGFDDPAGKGRTFSQWRRK